MGAIEPLPDSITGVQALLLMGYFNQFSYSKKAPMRVWMLCGLACKMATAMGLHRDGKRWNLGEEECQIRRTVYWEVSFGDDDDSGPFFLFFVFFFWVWLTLFILADGV